MTTLEAILSAITGALGVGSPVAVAMVRSRAKRSATEAAIAKMREATAGEALRQHLDRIDKLELRADALSDEVNDLRDKGRDCERRNDECERRSREQGAEIVELRKRLDKREEDITQRIERAVRRVTTPPRPMPAVVSPAEGERSEK